MLSKILFQYTETVIPYIVTPDLMCFISSRQSFYNICKLFYAFHSSQSAQQAQVVLSLDVEKAYNRLNGSTFLLLWKDFHLAHHSLHGSDYFMQHRRHQREQILYVQSIFSSTHDCCVLYLHMDLLFHHERGL